MRAQPAATRAVFSNDEQARDAPRSPIAVLGDPPRESSFPVDPGEQRLKVGDRGLDLDDEKRATAPVERQYVDGSSLAEDREGDLGGNLPVSRAQETHDRIDELGVGGVEESVEVFAMPIQPNRHSSAKGFGDPVDRSQRKQVGEASLCA
jgi:hypothetical protein